MATNSTEDIHRYLTLIQNQIPELITKTDMIEQVEMGADMLLTMLTDRGYPEVDVSGNSGFFNAQCHNMSLVKILSILTQFAISTSAMLSTGMLPVRREHEVDLRGVMGSDERHQRHFESPRFGQGKPSSIAPSREDNFHRAGVPEEGYYRSAAGREEVFSRSVPQQASESGYPLQQQRPTQNWSSTPNNPNLEPPPRTTQHPTVTQGDHAKYYPPSSPQNQGVPPPIYDERTVRRASGHSMDMVQPPPQGNMSYGLGSQQQQQTMAAHQREQQHVLRGAAHQSPFMQQDSPLSPASTAPTAIASPPQNVSILPDAQGQGGIRIGGGQDGRGTGQQGVYGTTLTRSQPPFLGDSGYAFRGEPMAEPLTENSPRSYSCFPIKTGTGLWGRMFEQSQGERRQAFELLAVTGIVTQKEFGENSSTIAYKHIDDCLNIAKDMMSINSNEYWANHTQQANNFFQEQLHQLYNQQFTPDKKPPN